MQTSELFSTWWTTTYIPIIDNGNELIKKLNPDGITLLHNTIQSFVNTLNEIVLKYYHVSYQVFSPDNEFHGPSFIYIATASSLYRMVVSLSIVGDNIICTPGPFDKIAFYSSLSSDIWATISTQPQQTGFVQPLEMENGFKIVFQQIRDFELLFNTETQMQIPLPQ